MKKLILIFVIALLSISSYAQKKIKVDERKENIGNGHNNALLVTIYGVSVSDVEKAWKAEMKKANAKVAMKSEIFADNAEIASISTNTIDIYAKIEKFGEDAVQLIVAFDLGGVYLSSSGHSSEFKSAEKILYNFAVKTSKAAIALKIKAAEKIYGKFVKEQDRLVKENETLNKNIKKWTEQIEQAKEDIKENEKAQTEKKKQIEEQKKAVDEIKAKEKGIN